MRRSILFIIIAFGVSGCTQHVWVKANATQQDYNIDFYACEKDMRQSGYYGSGVIALAEMEGFFNRCMFARGWSLQEVRNTSNKTQTNSNNSVSNVDRGSSKLDHCFERERKKGNNDYISTCAKEQ